MHTSLVQKGSEMEKEEGLNEVAAAMGQRKPADVANRIQPATVKGNEPAKAVQPQKQPQPQPQKQAPKQPQPQKPQPHPQKPQPQPQKQAPKQPQPQNKSENGNGQEEEVPKQKRIKRNFRSRQPKGHVKDDSISTTLNNGGDFSIESNGQNVDEKQSPRHALRVISLGGLNEVGKNMTVFETAEDIIVVDCGLAFPDDSMPGIDLVIPDFSYLIKKADKVRGIVITHGHEDHTGALPYVLRQLNVPVYATRLTCALIRNKLEEHKLVKTTTINEVAAGQTVKLGGFKVEFIRSNHSIPDAVALCIETSVGRIIHTGDFKIDTTPIDGEMIDLARLGELGKKGVLALISDSTNAERSGFTASEKSVGASLDRIFSGCSRRIIVTTFASNIHRVKQIMEVAEKYGRKVAVSGRSMLNNVKAAVELGIINAKEDLMIDIEKIKNYTPEKLVIITTGSQGEPMSALYRMAFADHRNVEIGKDDLVIVSASPIPGNEKTVSRVINELLKSGAEVISNKQMDIHVSGHAAKEEQKIMLALTKPKFFIPMHGEYRHLFAHADTAKEMGTPAANIIISDIGKVIELTREKCRFNGTVQSGKLLIDGLGVGDVGNVVLRDRKHLAQDGLIVIALTQSNGEIVTGPDIVSRGFVYVKESEDLMGGAREAVKAAIVKCEEAGLFNDRNALKNVMKDALSSYVYQKTKRNPMIMPIIMDV